jgi:hypothetical protein
MYVHVLHTLAHLLCIYTYIVHTYKKYVFCEKIEKVFSQYFPGQNLGRLQEGLVKNDLKKIEGSKTWAD